MEFEVGNNVYYNGFDWVVTSIVDRQGFRFLDFNNLDLQIPEELILPSIDLSFIDLKDDKRFYLIYDINTDKRLGTIAFHIDKAVSKEASSFMSNTNCFLFTDITLTLENWGKPQTIRPTPNAYRFIDLKKYFYDLLKEKKGQEGFNYSGRIQDYIKY